MGLTQLKTPEAVAQVLAPKVQGTLVLEHILQGVELDWLVLFSSVTSMTGGGPGQLDYCAANAFLDAYAQRLVGERRLTMSINWGEWQWNAWDAGLAGYTDTVQSFFRANRQRFGIHFEEGAEVFSRLLTFNFPQIVVSTQDFRQVMQLSSLFTAATLLAHWRQAGASRPKHARPTLGTSYMAPRNALERQIASIWGDLLGIEDIGIHDNFLELGGNSLLGTQLISRLRQAFQVNLSLSILFEALTVDELAIAVEMAIISELDDLGEEMVAPE
jgi:acyl carrier protein